MTLPGDTIDLAGAEDFPPVNSMITPAFPILALPVAPAVSHNAALLALSCVSLSAFPIVDDSVDRMVAAGGYVFCVPFAATGRPLADGMWVIAERTRGNAVSLSVRQVKIPGGQIELHPASTNPRHKAIRMAKARGKVRVVSLVRQFCSPLQAA